MRSQVDELPTNVIRQPPHKSMTATTDAKETSQIKTRSFTDPRTPTRQRTWSGWSRTDFVLIFF